MLDASAAPPSELLRAADSDVALHKVRIRAVLTNDASVLTAAMAAPSDDGGRGGGGGLSARVSDVDPAFAARETRRGRREAEASELGGEAAVILEALDAGPSKAQMTQAEVLAERLERWGHALELYVWCPEEGKAGGVGDVGAAAGRRDVDKPKVDLLGLLEKLCEGCSEVSSIPVLRVYVLGCPPHSAPRPRDIVMRTEFSPFSTHHSRPRLLGD